MSKGKPILDQNAFDFDQYNEADTELATLIQRRQNTIGHFGYGAWRVGLGA